VVTLFWTLDGLALALGRSTELDHDFLVALVSCQLWIPHTMLALELTDRYPIERGVLGRRIALHVAAIGFVVLTRPLLFMVTEPFVDWATKDAATQMLNTVRLHLFRYILVIGAAHAIHYAWRERERDRHVAALASQLTEARLAALRSQLQPHFLYNALGGIAELIHRDPQAADRMVVRLARLLRIALDERNAHEVTLAHELDCLDPYVELEKMRYGERLTVVTDIEPAARDAHVPGLLLQPLVENAIRHGIAPRSAPGTVRIRARIAGEMLEVEVEDDGVGIAPDLADGIGLRNTRARLAEHYGSAATLAIERRATGGSCAKVVVPQEAA
jgi:two-component system LytT family sensor kinase